MARLASGLRDSDQKDALGHIGRTLCGAPRRSLAIVVGMVSIAEIREDGETGDKEAVVAVKRLELVPAEDHREAETMLMRAVTRRTRRHDAKQMELDLGSVTELVRKAWGQTHRWDIARGVLVQKDKYDHAREQADQNAREQAILEAAAAVVDVPPDDADPSDADPSDAAPSDDAAPADDAPPEADAPPGAQAAPGGGDVLFLPPFDQPEGDGDADDGGPVAA
ncbi:MAG: hypothetical protein LBD51_03295 [Bifidobacteriaceae bacterium]|jgi:hypothetical protein|nr:hypothetical protein [Bifidobacteriaceae bacterium]